MHVLLVYPGVIPAPKYGGTERVIWYLGKELIKMGHRVTYLAAPGSSCTFTTLLILDKAKKITDQVPATVDLIHFNFIPNEEISFPYLITMHGNSNEEEALFDHNMVFVSRNHAERFGSNQFVHNGLDWDDYGDPALKNPRSYFHFLGNAAWRVKNVKGAIDVIKRTPQERLKVLGGTRLNFKMGFRLTLSSRVDFHGMVGNAEGHPLLRGSKGLIFPVRWHEPFGLAIVESLYFGCPVFGTPYGSLPELVPKEVGFLSNSAQELAEALQHSESYSKERCHEYVKEQFSAATMAKGYLQKYEQVLNGEKLNVNHPKLISRQQERFLKWSA